MPFSGMALALLNVKSTQMALARDADLSAVFA
jgi:hypothetical protein